MRRKSLLVSMHNADRRPWNGVCYEFLNVVAGIEDADIVAPAGRGHLSHPAPPDAELRAELAFRAKSRLLRLLGARRPPRTEPVELTSDYDICLYVCQFVPELQEIRQIRHWRERSEFAAVFILESWSSTFRRFARDLRLLDRFDQVFVFHGSCAEELRKYTSTPVAQLSTASDCLLATPDADGPERCIDIACIGRRMPDMHERLVEFAAREGWFYHYDAWSQMMASDWSAARRMNAEILKRSRYAVVWDPLMANAVVSRMIGRDRVLSSRYFESIAAGCVVIGSAPEAEEWGTEFDWPDVIVPLGEDPAPVLHELEADPERVQRIRRQNMTNALRRHDWAHRWKTVLEAAGHTPGPRHIERMKELDQIAARMQAAPLRLAGVKAI